MTAYSWLRRGAAPWYANAQEESMKRYFVAVLVAIIASGCTSTVTKSFKVFADPPDADIRVLSGPELKELKFHSPAAITAVVPEDPVLAPKAVLEVSKDNYKPFVMALRDIKDGQTLNVKLEKIVQSGIRYRPTCRLVSPAVSDTLEFRDATIAISFAVENQSFRIRLKNLRDRDVKILWEQAQFTDVNRQTSGLMHSGISFRDRKNPIPDQVVPARAEVQEEVIPINKVFFSQQKKAYEIQPIFPTDATAAAQLKGRTVNLFIPVEVDRTIIPYNFKIEIIDFVKEDVKG
jgi:hypothetical protein